MRHTTNSPTYLRYNTTHAAKQSRRNSSPLPSTTHCHPGLPPAPPTPASSNFRASSNNTVPLCAPLCAVRPTVGSLIQALPLTNRRLPRKTKRSNKTTNGLVVPGDHWPNKSGSQTIHSFRFPSSYPRRFLATPPPSPPAQPQPTPPPPPASPAPLS